MLETHLSITKADVAFNWCSFKLLVRGVKFSTWTMDDLFTDLTLVTRISTFTLTNRTDGELAALMFLVFHIWGANLACRCGF